MKLTEHGEELSAGLAMVIGAEDGECFRNSITGLMTHEFEDAMYVEGVASNEVLLCHHGWIELPCGTIVDPTPCYHTRSKRLAPAVYYPAERWSLDDIGDIFVLEEDILLPLLGWDGKEFKSRSYRDAYREAAMGTFEDAFADAYLSVLNKAYPDEE